MKHAGKDALDRLEPLLRKLRKRGSIREKTRGTFYRGTKAFLHFHEHGAECYADLRTGTKFERLEATTSAERRVLLARVDRLLADKGAGAKR